MYSVIEKKYNKIPKRTFASICNHGNTIYIFGGVGSYATYYNDLWSVEGRFIFNFDIYLHFIYNIYINTEKSDKIVVKEIQPLKKKNIPKPRMASSLHYYEDNLYIYAGYDGNEGFFKDIWQYSIIKNIWSKIEPKNDNVLKKCFGHTSIIFNENIIYFGGIDINNYYYNDIYLYNIKQNETKVYFNIANKPKPRCYHAATLHNNMLIIHGGFGFHSLNDCYVIDIKKVLANEKVSWYKYDINTPNLMYHQMISFKNRLMIYGGQLDGTYDENLIIFNENKEKSLIRIKEIKKRDKHSMYNINNKYIFIFAGDSDIGELNDMYFMQVLNNKEISLLISGFIRQYSNNLIPLSLQNIIQLFLSEH